MGECRVEVDDFSEHSVAAEGFDEVDALKIFCAELSDFFEGRFGCAVGVDETPVGEEVRGCVGVVFPKEAGDTWFGEEV